MKKTCYLMSSCLSYVLFLQVAQLATSELFVSKALASAQQQHQQEHSSSQSLTTPSNNNTISLSSSVNYPIYAAAFNRERSNQLSGEAINNVSQTEIDKAFFALKAAFVGSKYNVGGDGERVFLNFALTSAKNMNGVAAAAGSSSSSTNANLGTPTSYPVATLRFIKAAEDQIRQYDEQSASQNNINNELTVVSGSTGVMNNQQ